MWLRNLRLSRFGQALFRWCLRTTTTTSWCIRAHIVAKLCRKQPGTPQAQSLVAVQASGSSHLRLFQEGRCLGGAQRQKQVDTGCSGARSRKAAGPLGTTDTTEAHARHADHQTPGSDPAPDATVHAVIVAAAATCHDLRTSACSGDYKRGHHGALLTETMLLFLCLFAGLLCGDEKELEVQRLRLASLGEFRADLSST